MTLDTALKVARMSAQDIQRHDHCSFADAMEMRDEACTVLAGEVSFLTAFADPPDMQTGKTTRDNLRAQLATVKAERTAAQNEVARIRGMSCYLCHHSTDSQGRGEWCSLHGSHCSTFGDYCGSFKR